MYNPQNDEILAAALEEIGAWAPEDAEVETPEDSGYDGDERDCTCSSYTNTYCPVHGIDPEEWDDWEEAVHGEPTHENYEDDDLEDFEDGASREPTIPAEREESMRESYKEVAVEGMVVTATYTKETAKKYRYDLPSEADGGTGAYGSLYISKEDYADAPAELEVTIRPSTTLFDESEEIGF